ncbi:MAG: signal peptidase I [Elusimicrobiales bacterium]
MEEKLFLVGLLMGAYWLWFRRMHKLNRLGLHWGALVHGLFAAWLAHLGMMLLSISMESRVNSASPYSLTKEQLILWSAAIAIAFIWNFVRYLKSGDADRAEAMKSDLEWTETISSALLLASVVMFFLVQAFRIPSGSMRQTLIEGDRIFVNKISYGLKLPFTDKRILRLRPIKQGDVIVFRFPSDDPRDIQCGGYQYDKDFIKRLIGLPGDTVELHNGAVSVNGQLLTGEKYAVYSDTMRQSRPEGVNPDDYQKLWQGRDLGRAIGEQARDNFGPVKVPPGSYFAMGDNRDHSCDSRFWGPVPEKNIKGRAWFIYWPPNRVEMVH